MTAMNRLPAYALAAAVTALGWGDAAQAQTAIAVGDFQSTQHILSVEGVRHWMALVEERVGDSVSFTHFPAEQAAPAAGLLDAVRNNVIQAALMGPPYHTDRMPLNSIVGLPGLYTSSAQGSAVIHQMSTQGSLRQEYTNEGVVPIFSVVLPPYQILVRDRQLGMPSDWEGLNIRTGGTTQALTARALGAVGISLPGPEVYSAVERGRVDAVLFPLSSVAGYNLQEVVNYISANGALGGFSITMVMNQSVFEGLDEDVRDALLEAGNETTVHLAEAQDASIASLLEGWAAEGTTIFNFSQEELDAIAEAMAEVANDWVTRTSERNSAAAEVLEEYRNALATF